mmetsp:Transcript_11419/g.10342  ORF Transcript_11419/g.10342 Transcript_11419/m.10342 type:complete len:454 (-) Transcript_11419:1277-2638(-)|eukprot:CAMPEP_0196768360 /NCGR_PEP_ID=MMETSP1095-20130614/42655_1 /TAXON_ID=96789 ORGANISM="Chromulina nebulosa, Strain UTEXLB2642" /NCGR_SAMPLE_ID=MMETSP1095 /ASSEMBLY_ACC=CAM_ASM_000446 /LENGTH=453 /DNA_ID=CAMNT_0042137835 /DNA_START=307 /DNA_END=1668 /DNA_ORIENTATION=+
MTRTVGTTYKQYEAMIEWLEVPYNFNIIIGNALANNKNGAMSNRKLTKKDGQEDLAAYVNQKTCSRWDWNKAKARYERYVDKYKKTKILYESNSDKKFGLSNKDLKKGINSIEKKLDTECPFYRRMDLLFGGRQNVTPTVYTEPNKVINNNEETVDACTDDLNETESNLSRSSDVSDENVSMPIATYHYNSLDEDTIAKELIISNSKSDIIDNSIAIDNYTNSQNNYMTPKENFKKQRTNSNSNVLSISTTVDSNNINSVDSYRYNNTSGYSNSSGSNSTNSSSITSSTAAANSILRAPLIPGNNSSTSSNTVSIRGPSPTMQQIASKTLEAKKSNNNRRSDIRDVIHEAQTVEINMKNNELHQRLLEHNDNKARYEREFLREEKRYEDEVNYKKRQLLLDERKLESDEKKTTVQLELEKEKLKKETLLELIKLNKSEEEISRLMNILYPRNI